MGERDSDELVERLLADVAARQAVDERERASIERFLAEVPELARPFDEHADPRHVTASAIVVGPRGVVLLRHKRLGIWVQPGGHIDPGEPPWDAAVREAAEETGLDVRLAEPTSPRLVHVDVHPGPRGHTHLDVRYVAVAGDADPAPPPDESQAVAWFAWPDAIAVADEGLVGVLPSLAARYRSW